MAAIQTMIPVVIEQRLVRLKFSQNIAPTTLALSPSNYTIVITGTSIQEVIVQEVYADMAENSLEYVDLYISRPVPDTLYTVIAAELEGVDQRPFIDLAGKFTAKTTKVDSLTKNLSSIYSKAISSTIHQIITAVGISDEEIGGSTAEAGAVTLSTTTMAEEEEFDMPPSPRVTFTSVSEIAVDLPLAAMGQTVAYKLQSGFSYPFEGSDAANITVSGVGGLDTGSEASSTWYHLYLVPTGGVLRPILSTNAPATGPTGYANFLPIMAIYNDGSSNIREFHPVDSPWCHFVEVANEADCLLYASDSYTGGSWVSMTGVATAVPTAVTDEILVSGWMDSDAGQEIVTYVDPGNPPGYTPGSTTSIRGAAFFSGEAATSGANRAPVALPGSTLSFYTVFVVGSGSINIAFRAQAFRHQYRI